MNTILDVQGIHSYIKQYHILQGVDVNVPEGTITTILGRNGAGKTTTLNPSSGWLLCVPGKSSLKAKKCRGWHPMISPPWE